MAAFLLLAACGDGGDELSLEEYFQRVLDIGDAAETRADTLEEESQGLGEDLNATRDYFDGLEAIAREALSDLRDIDPPAEVRDAHDEFVAGVAATQAVWKDLSDRIRDLESPSEVQALLFAMSEDPAFSAAFERQGNACVQLQGIADENGIDVDLECEEAS